MISVIICTHNPRQDHLRRVAKALLGQSLEAAKWELLLVDNASTQPLNQSDFLWHPHYRYICESELGLTRARLRGIKEATTSVLVFVDDDNVIDSKFLEYALAISEEWPVLGAWGGTIQPEFEVVPEEWTRKYWPMLAIREFDRDRWSNSTYDHSSIPCGAGMVVRAKVAKAYAQRTSGDFQRMNLDRKGSNFSSCGDTDLALTSIDLGLGTGYFTRLKVTHLLPQKRLTEDYLLKLYEGMTYSQIVAEGARSEIRINQPKSMVRWVLDTLRLALMDGRSRRFELVRRRSVRAALKDLTSQNNA